MPNKVNKTDSKIRKIQQGVFYGTSIMIAQSPFVNGFNAVSVLACKQNLHGWAPFHAVYTGTHLHQNQPRSIFNFLCGIQAHFGKEVPRLLFKPAGLYALKPWLDSNFSSQYSTVIFAGTLSVCEVLVNPADSIRVQRQAGNNIDYSLRTLYRGAGANGVRQFLTWSIFSSVSQLADDNLLNPQGIDKHSALSIMIKSWCVGAALALIFPVERIKNEVQYNPQDYKTAAKLVLKRGGLFCGVGAKMCSNTILAAGALSLVTLGS